MARAGHRDSTVSVAVIGNVLFGADDTVRRMVSERTGGGIEEGPALGMLDREGRIGGGVTYQQYRPAPGGRGTVECAIAVWNRAVLTRRALRIIFRYPYEDLQCWRITVCIAATNTASLSLCTRLGFVVEGRLRQAEADGTDTIVMGMLRPECPWIAGIIANGQENAVRPNAA